MIVNWRIETSCDGNTVWVTHQGHTPKEAQSVGFGQHVSLFTKSWSTVKYTYFHTKWLAWIPLSNSEPNSALVVTAFSSFSFMWQNRWSLLHTHRTLLKGRIFQELKQGLKKNVLTLPLQIIGLLTYIPEDLMNLI